MNAALEPHIALGYLRELCPQISASTLLDGAGRRLAGSEALGAWVRGGEAPSGAAEEQLHVVRSPTMTVAALAPRGALTEPLLADMGRLLDDLAPSAAGATVDDP